MHLNYSNIYVQNDRFNLLFSQFLGKFSENVHVTRHNKFFYSCVKLYWASSSSIFGKMNDIFRLIWEANFSTCRTILLSYIVFKNAQVTYFIDFLNIRKTNFNENILNKITKQKLIIIQHIFSGNHLTIQLLGNCNVVMFQSWPVYIFWNYHSWME